MSWVEKTSSGSLRLCERIKVDGSWKRLTVPLEKDTAQARRRATEALEEKKREMLHPINKRSLKSLMELYMSKKDCRPSTMANTKRSLMAIYNTIGEIPLEPSLINQKLLEDPRKPSAVNVNLMPFRAFLRWCFRYGYIPEDIAPRVPNLPDKTPKKDPDQKYLEHEELADALDQMAGMYLYLSKFLVLSGCRIGEAIALTMEDLDDDYIHITKTHSEYGIGEAKTRSSMRDVSIQQNLAELLEEYKRWRLLYMVSKGIRTDLLFFSPSGEHIYRNAYDAYLNKIKGPKHIHAHMFRHTHVALLAEQGVPLDVISRRLGHEDSRITKDIYFHVTKKLKQRDAEILANVKII